MTLGIEEHLSPRGVSQLRTIALRDSTNTVSDNMKTGKYWMVVPTVLATIVTSAGVASSNPPVLEMARSSQTEPIVVSGTSGGTNKTNCGNIGSAPNQVVKVTQGQIDYMRFSVKAEGQPTMVVEGPGGRFCVLADKASGESPEMSGVWPAGTYKIFIGDRSGGQHPFTLSITQKR